MKTPEADILTEIMLAVFRANGRLLEAGDELVRHLGLTSARWQILGAVAMSPEPLTAPRVAEAMGLTRQGAQKQLNLLVDEGLIQQAANPGHQKSPFYSLTPKGSRVYNSAMVAQTKWSNALAKEFSRAKLATTLGVLRSLNEKLDHTKGTSR